MISPHFACACWLLAPYLLRSTLDTKEGYKTKTGSTSSVTLTLMRTTTLHLVLHLPLPIALTQIEYWDRVVGGRNIV